jgi:Tol biopolymer transport system component
MARQIAAALEAAHECGIVHRDLKPANIKVRGDGVVKVLDFGLARALDPQSASAGAALPTITSPAITAMGVILGTAAYMSPEQARGQPVDKRADIWAFGVVLFEMLSGRRLFDGATVSDALAAVLRQEVPWDALPASTPMPLRRLLQRCLQRDPAKRLRDIGDARLDDEVLDEDEGARGGRATPARRSPWHALAWIGSVVLAASAAAAAAWIARTPPDPPARRFTIATEDGAPPTEAAISPDGRFVAYVTAERVWLQQLTEARAREVPGSDQARSIFWSPDSGWLGFQVRGQLWKIAVTGGSAPIAIARLPADFTVVGAAAWLRDGRILFGTGSSGLYEVPAGGGTPRIVVALEAGKDNDFHDVRALPDGNTVVFLVHPIGEGPYTLDAFNGKSRKRVFSPNSDIQSPSYSPTGHLLFIKEGDLWAVVFDAAALEARGNPFLVEAGADAPSVATDGTLVLVPGAGGGPQELVWLDRAGKLSGALSSVNAPIAGMRLSPDGTRALAAVNSAGNTDVWLFDTTRIAEQRLTREAEADNSPAWLSDGRIAYSCARKVCTRAADGSTERRVIAEGPVFGVTSTPDGTSVVLSQAGVTTLSDIFLLAAPAGPPGSALKPVIALDRQQRRSDVSPDGKYIAYESNETGRYEVYASRFPSGEGKWDVSRGIGFWPRWSTKGDRIFFVDDRARIVEVDVQGASSFSAGAPRVAVSTQQHGVDPARDGFDRSVDGQRFLVARSRTHDRRRSSVLVVENWFTLFRGAGK